MIFPKIEINRKICYLKRHRNHEDPPFVLLPTDYDTVDEMILSISNDFSEDVIQYFEQAETAQAL